MGLSWREVVAYHESQKPHYRELRKKRERQAAKGRSLAFRRRKREPPYAAIEQAVIPALLALSTDAIRVYCTLCWFANGKTGLAYPSQRKLIARLGGVPFFTDFVTGIVRVGLTKAQKSKCNAQKRRFATQLASLIDELVESNLVARTTKTIRTANGVVDYDALCILRPDGSIRRMRDLKFRHAYFQIPARLLDIGVFGIWRTRPRNYYQPIPDKTLRVLLLALRDNDELRYGGIDPAKVWYEQEQVACDRYAWPTELIYSVPECVQAIEDMTKLRILKRTHGVFSREHGHLIGSRRAAIASGSERMCTYFRIA